MKEAEEESSGGEEDDEDENIEVNSVRGGGLGSLKWQSWVTENLW